MYTATDKNYPIWHPYARQNKDFSPIKIKSAKGVFLIDEHGHTIIDAISSWWVNIHGHSHPKIAEAIYKQAQVLEQVIFSNFVHEPALTLAHTLLKILPGKFHKVFFSDNGSTAVEVALKTALQYWRNKQQPKTKILALKNSYHGDTFGAMSLSSRSVFTKAFESLLFEVEYIDSPINADYIPHLQYPPDAYACFIYEPMLQAAGGMHIHHKKGLENLLRYLKKNNILLIADEVMTGWGRTGKNFAGSYTPITPDIICLSKGLTGGFLPLGITACTHRIYNAFKEDTELTKTLFHGHSFTANPLACAAANASIQLFLQKKCQQKIALITQMHQLFIKEIKNFPEVKNPRSIGTLLAFELNNPQNNYTSPIRDKIMTYFLKGGIFVRPLGNTFYLMPPYAISVKTLHYLYDYTKKMLKSGLLTM